VLYPDRDVSAFTTNDGSIMGILQYGSTSIMFTGDATVKSEATVITENTPADLKADILKVGHHGSPTSSSDAFVKAVAPTYAVISAGVHNKYNLPKQSTIDTLEKYEAKVLRTDKQGTITFISDGKTLTQTQ
jgi:competence protein ComEC